MNKRTAILLSLGHFHRWSNRGLLDPSKSWGGVTEDLVSSTAFAEAGTTTGVLKLLRSGETNTAVEILENELDGALITLGATLSTEERNTNKLRILEMAKSYRSQHPRTNVSAEVGEAVNQALQMVGNSGK